ncbi:hypothetical protein BN1088_1300004 [Sphingobacterium sp. PM2-P1-29]|nr:hypothetical protein BN1088_1300004 [Sphingobacterium sp. PM2-P1-29]
MFIKKISIIIKTKVNKDKLYDEFNLLLSFYRGNGQTQGNIESQYIKRDCNKHKQSACLCPRANQY